MGETKNYQKLFEGLIKTQFHVEGRGNIKFNLDKEPSGFGRDYTNGINPTLENKYNFGIELEFNGTKKFLPITWFIETLENYSNDPKLWGKIRDKKNPDLRRYFQKKSIGHYVPSVIQHIDIQNTKNTLTKIQHANIQHTNIQKKSTNDPELELVLYSPGAISLDHLMTEQKFDISPIEFSMRHHIKNAIESYSKIRAVGTFNKDELKSDKFNLKNYNPETEFDRRVKTRLIDNSNPSNQYLEQTFFDKYNQLIFENYNNGAEHFYHRDLTLDNVLIGKNAMINDFERSGFSNNDDDLTLFALSFYSHPQNKLDLNEIIELVEKTHNEYFPMFLNSEISWAKKRNDKIKYSQQKDKENEEYKITEESIINVALNTTMSHLYNYMNLGGKQSSLDKAKRFLNISLEYMQKKGILNDFQYLIQESNNNYCNMIYEIMDVKFKNNQLQKAA